MLYTYPYDLTGHELGELRIISASREEPSVLAALVYIVRSYPMLEDVSAIRIAHDMAKLHTDL